MAGVDWSKYKGANRAKSVMAHNDKDKRENHGHENEFIDKTKTPQNFAYRNLSYEQKCAIYNETIESTMKRKSTGKNENVTMFGLVFWLPKELQNGGKYDPETVKNYFHDIGAILEYGYPDKDENGEIKKDKKGKDKYIFEGLGKDFIDLDVHVDELHPYIDTRSKDWQWSRIHAHASIIPVVKNENGERTLNAKKFYTRKRINALNEAVEKMSVEKYGVHYITGEWQGTKDRRSMKELKAGSYELIMKAAEENLEREKMNDRREEENARKAAELKAKEENLQELIEEGKKAKEQRIQETADTAERANRPLPGEGTKKYNPFADITQHYL